jgi:putative holliday junction resolvase
MKYMGLDLGSKSCGIAVTDPYGQLIRGLKNLTFDALNYDQLTDTLKNVIETEKIEHIVIGYPLSLSGEEKTETNMAKRLKKALAKKTECPIELFDERFSSKRASAMMIEQNLSRKNRKSRLDEMSAVIILTDYLTWKGNQNE